MNAFRDRRRLFSGLVVTALCSAVMASPVFAGESTPASAGQAQPASEAGVPQPAGGFVIYVDPQTGQFLKEPPPGTARLRFSRRVRNALSTSDRGLVLEPLRHGGFKVNLQGRFRSPVFATTDASGNVRVLHSDEVPEPAK